jgi:hypothetical protein
MSLYDNIFALTKLTKLTPEYVENCTPGEYLLFVKKLEAMNSKQITNEPVINNNDFNDEEDFGYPEIPPVTSSTNYTP